MKFVIGLGGSLLTKELNSENFRKYADVLIRLKKEGYRLIVVCGGGKICRDYQNIAKDFGADNIFLDKVGIITTHLNASVLIAALGEHAHQDVIKTISEIKKAPEDKILVCGGYEPGHSTDFDSAIFAEAIKADWLIKATDIDGVYSSDPRENPEAKKFDKLNYKQFKEIISKNKQEPGQYRLFDLSAIKIIERSKTKLVVIDASDPEEIIRAVEGKDKGTRVF